MGCVPILNSKKSDLHNLNTKAYTILTNKEADHGKSDKKNLIQQIKIIGSILVQECTGDPLEIYDVLNKLGEGTFGEVFKVIHKHNKSIRAMKVINKIKSCMGEEEEKGIINEINILKTLDHPNIIKV